MYNSDITGFLEPTSIQDIQARFICSVQLKGRQNIAGVIECTK
jgi:hypothetical protein